MVRAPTTVVSTIPVRAEQGITNTAGVMSQESEAPPSYSESQLVEPEKRS